MELPQVEAVLDALGDSVEDRDWDYLKEDAIYIYLWNKKAKRREPHLRIDKQIGTIQALNGINFMKNGKPIGYIMTCEDFINMVKNERHK